jgi:hypothetical protein
MVEVLDTWGDKMQLEATTHGQLVLTTVVRMSCGTTRELSVNLDLDGARQLGQALAAFLRREGYLQRAEPTMLLTEVVP